MMRLNGESKMIKTKKVLWLVLLFLISAVNAADMKDGGVYSQTVDKNVSAVYDKVYKSLELAGFYVVFEPNIGANLKHFEKKWGDNYNQNNLDEIRSMVFCNGWYANKVSNVDPNMLGFCPLHITLIERSGKTTVLFNRPTVIGQHSPASAIFERIEAEVIEAIQLGLKS